MSKPRPETASSEPSAPKAAKTDATIFRVAAATAGGVVIIGDFTGWKERKMDRRDGGLWETAVTLKPGTYHYLFRIDGRWTLDPSNGRTGRRGPLTVSVWEER